jgi:hypothetical protein
MFPLCGQIHGDTKPVQGRHAAASSLLSQPISSRSWTHSGFEPGIRNIQTIETGAPTCTARSDFADFVSACIHRAKGQGGLQKPGFAETSGIR